LVVLSNKTNFALGTLGFAWSKLEPIKLMFEGVMSNEYYACDSDEYFYGNIII